MDESFLSQKEVIEASRQFVCVRLATYENEAEAKYTLDLHRFGSGKLENTVFTILAPDGKEKLVRSGRSPSQVYGRSQAKGMAGEMQQIALVYGGKKPGNFRGATLPLAADFRLGLNIAACDQLPLLVVYGKTDAESSKLKEKLVPIVWGESLIGRYQIVTASKAEELKEIEGFRDEAGYVVVQPGEFGLKGKVLGQFAGDMKSAELTEGLESALAKTEVREKRDSREHHIAGRNKSVHWKTKLPVTDPGRPAGRSGRGQNSTRGGGRRSRQAQ